MIGRTLAHYKINVAIGAGGMGEVYRATDTKLGRDIALKVLPSEMAGDPDRLARFQREARAVAALNHPNVVTVYSVEEADNVHFITMELLEGQPLDQLISANGLPAERIIEIAGAIAEALTAAHEKGIVHRDLKPANVMVTNEGRVKVLDFGLAKDVGAEMASDATLTSAGHTEVGVVMGTPSYMSPEQVSGRPLDHRSDIFSFGVLLHEMATGRRPFEGSSSAELISSILRDNPPSVTDARPELPSDLARVIRRCLEKDPRYRMQTARDVSNEFRDLVRTTRPTPISSSTPRATPAHSGSGQAAVREPVREDEGFWVAVLPFKFKGSEPGLDALAEGMTEEIVTGMSRFPYLRVIAHGSTLGYANRAVDLRQVGKELGARYMMEGSLRQSGSRLRIAAQLVDAASGTQLWAETYDRALQPEAIFELQDEVLPRIVSTVGDTQGILAQSMSEAVWNKAPDRLTPYEAVLRSFSYMRRVNPQNHGAARDALERAVEHAPGNGLAWAMLAIIFREEYNHGFNPRPDPLGRALTAARRAVEAEPSNYLAHHALASVHFFRRELEAFRSETQTALRLNPMDGYTFGYLGMLTAFAGDWERGCALSEKARSPNPQHPGWYWFAPLFDAFRKQEYRLALDLAQKVNMPHFWRTNLALAATYGHLGEAGPAGKTLQMLVTARPEFAASPEEECSKWWNPDLADQIVEGLRKAGLSKTGFEIPHEDKPAAQTSALSGPTSAHASGAARADEGFWVAVLPFKYTGSNADLKSLAEGLSEEVITGLSRFSYLRVIARGSTAKYSSESGDIRAIGKEIGARYVMEASLRQAGNKLRLAVQLVDAISGAHLWAETYERAFSPEAVFELQDELVPRIVSTVADMNGMLPRSMSEAVRSGDPEQLSPYEAVLRSFGYFERVTPEDLASAQSGLEAAVRKAPAYGDAWAMLALLHVQDYAQGFGVQADALTSGTSAARRAVAAAPSNHLAHFGLAQALFFQKEFPSFRNAAERAVELNPMDGNSLALLAEFFTYSGDAERGLELADRAKQLNPNHPGWYWHVNFNHAYAQGDYRGALRFILKSNMTENWGRQALAAAAYGQLGEREEASKMLQELRRLRPDVAHTIQREIDKWFAAKHAAHLLEGLRKAGLEIGGESAFSGTSNLVTGKAPDSGAARADEGFWVAVLPFKYTGSNADLKALAEGLSEEVITGLSRFSYLRVIARGSTAKYSGESGDIRAIGKELGARYVMEASLRQAGTKLRLAVQVVDATTGAHLWAENYERTFSPEDIFTLQDDLVPRIVSTVADLYGVLPHTMSEAVRSKPPDQMTPYEAVLRCCGYGYRATPEEHADARAAVELAVQKAPAYSAGWAMLSFMYVEEYAEDFNVQPDPLGRALKAAQRAVDAGPSNPLAYAALARTLFFLKELPAFRNAAQRAIELNPLDGATLAMIGELTAYSGDWERGCSLVEQAAQLNPRHPGWYWLSISYNAYRRADYRTALRLALKTNLPGFFYTHAVIAASHGQLGEIEEAAKALLELHKLRPDFAAIARREFGKRWDPDLIERFVEGLRKAGLEIPSGYAGTASAPVAAATGVHGASGAVRADEGFWVAVLPFKYTGSNADLKALAEGLSEEVITGLSRFSYLRVIARGSTAKYSSESGDIRAIGKELGARYVMEASLRQAGSKLRLAVQLVDAATGAHLWAETYERAFTPESVFELQDDLVPRIVATVADQYGVLPRTMSEVLRSKPEDSLTPHEAVLRTFSYFTRLTPEEHAMMRRILERAVREAPDHADSWAMLSMIYRGEYAQGFNPGPNPLDRALSAAQRAVDLAPAHALGHYALATVHFFRKEKMHFRVVAERALALNPMDGSVLAYLGLLIARAGERDRGCQMVNSAMRLNPHYPGWFYIAAFDKAYCEGKYAEALEALVHMNTPGYFHLHAARAAALGQLGQRDEAQKALQDLLALRPDFASAARGEYAKWYDPDEVEHMIDGLRKAGLKIEQG